MKVGRALGLCSRTKDVFIVFFYGHPHIHFYKGKREAISDQRIILFYSLAYSRSLELFGKKFPSGCFCNSALQAHAVRIIINRLIVSIPVYTDTSICISRIHAYVTYYTIVCLLKKLFFLSRNKRRPVMAEIYRFAGFVYISLQIYVNKFSWN